MTGLRLSVYHALLEYIVPFLNNPRTNIPLRNQVTMFLVRMRLNIPQRYLSLQIKMSLSTVNSMLSRILDVMYAKIGFLVRWPDREGIFSTIPPHFKQFYPRLTCIIDCFEIFMHRPKRLKARQEVYSNYKKHSTVKFLIGISPTGAVLYLSEPWGGRVPDIHIVKESGFISPTYHDPRDQILADRGFTLEEDFGAICSAELVMPNFTRGKQQLPGEEVDGSRKTSNVRIHVERVIGSVKQRYHVLNGPIPINVIKSATEESDGRVPNIQRLVTVACALVNLSPGVVL